MAKRRMTEAGTAAATTTAVVDAPAGTAAPKKRGRPKGSKNKTSAAKASAAPARRGPGRPKGSRNKAAAAKAAATKPATGAKRGRPAGTGLERKITVLIRELEAVRAQVQQLEQLRAAVKSIRV
jgi:hypothetical protein